MYLHNTFCVWKMWTNRRVCRSFPTSIVNALLFQTLDPAIDRYVDGVVMCLPNGWMGFDWIRRQVPDKPINKSDDDQLLLLVLLLVGTTVESGCRRPMMGWRRLNYALMGTKMCVGKANYYITALGCPSRTIEHTVCWSSSGTRGEPRASEFILLCELNGSRGGRSENARAACIRIRFNRKLSNADAARGFRNQAHKSIANITNHVPGSVALFGKHKSAANLFLKSLLCSDCLTLAVWRTRWRPN